MARKGKSKTAEAVQADASTTEAVADGTEQQQIDAGTEPKAKATPKQAKPVNGIDNPFRDGTAAAWMFARLCKGGNAGTIAKESTKKFPVKPRHADSVEDVEAHAFSEGLLRINDALRVAKREGLTAVKDGKGADATVSITK